jgi:two-component system, NtrC family, nitrogen regulation sensor histidine kinase NtrY
MGSDRVRTVPLPLRLAFSAVVFAALVWALAELLAHTRLYATALIVAVAALLALADLFRTAGRADVILSQILDRLTSGAADRSLGHVQGFPSLARAADLAAARLRRGREDRQREIEYLRALLDTVPAALMVLKADGDVVLSNRAAFALAGREARRLSDIPALAASAAAILALPPGARAMLPAAGDRKMFVSVSQLSAPDGRALRLVALQPVAGGLDVVEQAAWRDLMRVLAHEMMNSLTPIVSLSESVAARPSAEADPEAQAALQVIARRAGNLMTFVDRYRAVADTPKPALAPVRLDALTGDIARLMAGSLAGAGATLEVRVEPPDLMVEADRGLLEQAVINLVKNALDATRGQPAPRVELLCRRLDSRVTICVADNGEGVPPDRMETIFIPFFTSRAGGSGIGLSLARQIALAHGGQLTVAANAPRGAVFEISLPDRPESDRADL